jgi:hypothetical protein
LEQRPVNSENRKGRLGQAVPSDVAAGVVGQMVLLLPMKFSHAKMEKSGSGAESKRKKAKTSVAGTSWETRQVVAEWAMAAKASGTPVHSFAKNGEKSSYSPNARTLQLHVAALEKGESPFKEEKETGRAPALLWEQKKVLCGAVLMSEEKVDLLKFGRLSEDYFGVFLPRSTASRYKDELGLSFQLIGSRPMPKRMSNDEYVLGCVEFLQNCRNDGFFNVDVSKLACADSFTNSIRTFREKTLNGIGKKQKKFPRADYKYTDGFTGCQWGDGINRTPCLHWSFNPAYSPSHADAHAVNCLFKDLDLNRDRTFFEKSTKFYCAEKNTQISNFVQRYSRELKGSHVLFDGGPAWKIKKHYVVEGYVQNFRVLPAAQHGELSVMDNNFNSIVKARWKAQFDRKTPEWADALYLLKLTDGVDSASVARMFQRNYLLGEKELSVAAVEASLNGTSEIQSSRDRFFDECIEAWEEFMEARRIGETPVYFKGDDCNLDGLYWT